MVGKALVPIIVVGWAGVTLWAFWNLQMRYLRPVGRPAGAAIADPIHHPLPAVSTISTDVGPIERDRPGPVTLLNFWNDGCPCTRYMEGHVRQLVDEYQPLGVRFITVIENEDPDRSKAQAVDDWHGRHVADMPVVYDNDCEIARRFGVWACPGAVIIDAKGHVQFVGSYNAARYCGNPNTAWAAQSLASVVSGRTPRLHKTLFFGCTILGQRLYCSTLPRRG